jgi:hypothetical protein
MDTDVEQISWQRLTHGREGSGDEAPLL